MQGIKVYNILGQLVKSIHDLNKSQYNLSTIDLASGFYTIHIHTQDGIITQKFEVIQ